MSIFSKLFGSKEIIQGGIDLIDSFHTSDVEKIEANTESRVKIIQAKTEAKVSHLNAYAPFKIAQRFLAIVFSVTFVLSFLLVLGMTLAGKGHVEAVKGVLSEFYIGEIMLTIIFFYFGGGAVEGIAERFKRKI